MRKLVMTSIAGATIAAAVLAPGAFAGPGTTVIYDNTPAYPHPGNILSKAFEAQSTQEFGEQVAFSGTARELSSVVVTMSVWACKTGHWYSGDCASDSTDQATVPIKFSIYNVAPDGTSVGSEITATTKPFVLPYRPSADATCGDGRWLGGDGTTCFNGYAVPITFTFDPGIILPDKVIYDIAFATSHNGSPLEQSSDNCGTEAGCFVDSLNVGEGARTDYNYLNASWSGAYCDGGTTGSFRYDGGGNCETPAVQFNAVTPGPTCPAGSVTKTGNISGNLTVPSNQSYCLDNAHVAGDITVQKGASLTMINGSSSGHDVKGKDVNSVTIDSSTVLHDVVVSGATGSVSVTNSTIGHDLNLTGNKGSVTADSNVIGHDMNVKNNTGTSSATNNTVSHYQNCTGNAAFTGSANTGTGAAAASCNTP